MKYLVKYRLSDGGVVDSWVGPDQVPHPHDHGGVAPRTFGELVKDALAIYRPKRYVNMVHPSAALGGQDQDALEVTRADFEQLGPITDSDGRLRWRVAGGRLERNQGELYASERVVTSQAPINGTLHRLT